MHALCGALSVLFALASCPAWAERERPSSGLTVYSAKGVDSNLPDLTGRLVKGSLDYHPTWFEGLGYTFGTRTPGFIDRTFRFLGVRNVSAGAELIGVKHRGIQGHFEATAAYRLSTPYLGLGPIETRLGYSLGLSYAFETPIYERAPDGQQDRLLTYMAYELETKLRQYEPVSVVARVHHRSGAYGLFAPKGSGSNFVALGLRVHW